MKWRTFTLVFADFVIEGTVEVPVEVLSDFDDEDIYNLEQDVLNELHKHSQHNFTLIDITGDFESKKHKEYVLYKIAKDNIVLIEDVLQLLIDQEFINFNEGGRE